jgi:hypothetical protein
MRIRPTILGIPGPDNLVQRNTYTLPGIPVARNMHPFVEARLSRWVTGGVNMHRYQHLTEKSLFLYG